jgi:hypothetical protein
MKVRGTLDSLCSSIEQEKDSRNLIGQEQKLVLWIFTLEAIGHWATNDALQNAYMATLFVSFGPKNLSNRRKFVQNMSNGRLRVKVNFHLYIENFKIQKKNVLVIFVLYMTFNP